jgi:hypothetical protein
MQPTRRSFLRAAGAAGLGAALAGLPGRARGLGAPPPGCGYKLLEVFVHSAPSHRETLWIEANPAGSRWWTQTGALTGANPTVAAPQTSVRSTRCRRVTSTGGVYLGPCAAPLVGTPLFDRLRLVALRHDVPAHDQAAHLALTGALPGRPGGACRGAAIQRALGAGNRVAYVCAPTDLPQPIARSAVDPGALSAAHRPVLVPVGDPDFLARLGRPGRGADDDLLRHYRDRYAARLSRGGARTRSVHFDGYDAHLDQLLDAGSLQAVLSGGPSLAVAQPTFASNHATQAVALAAHLLASGARYAAAVVHGGLESCDTHAGQRSHDENYVIHAGNLWGLLRALRLAVQNQTLDLDSTLIVVHSEFGRRPSDPSDGAGTEHWTEGYPALLLGGPLQTRTLANTIDFAATPHGRAVGGLQGAPTAFSPTDLHAALLLAAGVDPFGPDLLTPAMTTLGAGADAATARARLGLDLLGVGPASLTCATTTPPHREGPG